MFYVTARCLPAAGLFLCNREFPGISCYMKKSPLISTILVKGDHNIHNYDSLFIPVVVYSLYVIILVKEIKDSLHLLDRFLVSKFYHMVYHYVAVDF